MFLDEFCLDIYRQLFIQWIACHHNQFLEQDIDFHIQTSEKTCTLSFESSSLQGRSSIWPQNIIEEEITHKQTDKQLFYLHFLINNLDQCIHMFHEFYQSFLFNKDLHTHRIALCCTGGLSTAVFIDHMKDICISQNIPIQLESLSYDQIEENYLDYEALYLAPQIAYKEPDIIQITHHSLPVYQLDALDFATKNYHKIIQTIQSQLENHS